MAPARRPFPLRTGVAEVLHTRPVGPRTMRVTLGGEGLDDFFVEQPGEIVTLIWPAPGRELVLPASGWRFPPGVAEAQHARNYTVRRWDADRRRLVVDFVLHGDHGHASRWAAAARPGDRVGFAGPRVHWTDGPAADWTLLLADETGLPALAAIAETLPPRHPAVALVEVTDGRDEQPVVTHADLDVRWLHRGKAEPGAAGLLERSVRDLVLPCGRGRAWGAAESSVMRRVRRQLRMRHDLRAEGVSLLGYWTRGAYAPVGEPVLVH